LTLGLLAIGSGASRVKRHQQDETNAATAESEVPKGSAVDILCAGGRLITMRKWADAECGRFSLSCQEVTFLCPEDDRSDTILLEWHNKNILSNIASPLAKIIGKKKQFHILRDAMPVSAEGMAYRFFLGSHGCPGESSKDSGSTDCALPWPDFAPVRESEETANILRFYLLFDGTEPGKPKVSIESNSFQGKFSESTFQPLGTGVEAPPASPMFAGSTGTGCGVGLPCGEPLTTPDPVEFMQWNVTKKFVTEYPAGSGEYAVKFDTNFGEQQKTYSRSFKENHKR